MQKIIAWIKGLPLWLRAGAVGFVIGAIVCTGITGIIAGRQLSDLRAAEAAVVSSIAELKRQNQELTDIVAKFGTKLDSCTSSVAAVGKQVQQLGGAVQNLGASVDTIKRDVKQISTGQSDVDAKLSNLGNTISSLGESIHGLTESIHSATTGIQQASDELSGTDSIIEQATGILQGLPKASQEGTK